MRHYPVGLDLEGRRVLIVGAGEVAARKCARLLSAGARPTVVAPAACPAIEALHQTASVALRRRAFTPGDLLGKAFVVAAADRRTNRLVAVLARRRRLPVNVVDDGAASTAVLPAVLERGPLTVAIATGGLAPAVASWLRGRLEAFFAVSLGPLLDRLGALRGRFQEAFPDPRARRGAYHAVLSGGLAQRLAEGDETAAVAELAALLAEPAAGGRVSLVGAGPGDARYLTLAALAALQDADVVLHDRLVDPGILRLARAEATLVDVGKRCGEASTAQQQIHELLITHARAGHHVVRLKAGDPLIFARGGEELAALRQAGIAVTVIPGVTAASACAAAAAIPLTHRGQARSLRLVTAHTREGPSPFGLLRHRPDETLAVYMGLRQLPELSRALRQAGHPGRLPVALVQAAGRAGECVRRGRLAGLPALADGLDPRLPTLLLVGEVCGLEATVEPGLGLVG